MAGRGRSATLPAWMTQGKAKPVVDTPTTIDVAMPAPTPDDGKGKKGKGRRGRGGGRGVSAPSGAPPPMRSSMPPAMGLGASAGRGKSQTLPAWMRHDKEAAAKALAARSGPSAASAPRGVSQFSRGPGVQQQQQQQQQQAAQPFIQQRRPARNIPSFGMPPNFGQRRQQPVASSGGPVVAGTQTQNSVRPPPPAGAPPAADTGGWTTHAGPGGRPYYYHAATKTSQWTKPDALKTPAERAAAAAAWKEFKAPDGRSYFYNSVTAKSVWEEPAELKAARLAAAAATTASSGQANGPPHGAQAQAQAQAPQGQIQSQTQPNPHAAAGSTNAPSSADSETPAVAKEEEKKKEPKKPKKPRVLPVYASKEEAVAAFISLLEQKKISSKLHWKELARKVSYDVRWEAIKSLGERKQVYSEWRDRRAREEKLEEQARRTELRSDFEQLLRETPSLNPRVRFREAEELLEKDARFSAIESSSEREDIYADFMAEWDEKERAERRAKKKAAIAKFNAVLDSAAGPDGSTPITADSKWDDVKERIKDHPDFEVLPRGDRYDMFKERVAVLRKAADEEERRKRRAAKEAARKVEASVRELLQSLRADGKIDQNTTYDDVKSQLLDVADFAKAEELKPGFLEEVVKDVAERLRIRVRRLRRDLDPYCALAHPDEAAFATLAFADFKSQLAENAKEEKPQAAPVEGESEAEGEKPDEQKSDSAAPKSDGASSVEKKADEEKGEKGEEGGEEDSAARESRKRKHSSRSRSASRGRRQQHHPSSSSSANDSAELQRKYATALLTHSDVDLMSGLEWLREDQAKERERLAERQKKLEQSFRDLLMDYYNRSDHIAVPWSRALRRVRHRSAFRDLAKAEDTASGSANGGAGEAGKEAEAVPKTRPEVLFDEHIKMLREQLGVSEEEIKKAEEEEAARAAKEGHSSSDDSDDGDRRRSRRKRSKSEKKKKSSRSRHKRSRRSSSRSRS